MACKVLFCIPAAAGLGYIMAKGSNAGLKVHLGLKTVTQPCTACQRSCVYGTTCNVGVA